MSQKAYIIRRDSYTTYGPEDWIDQSKVYTDIAKAKEQFRNLVDETCQKFLQCNDEDETEDSMESNTKEQGTTIISRYQIWQTDGEDNEMVTLIELDMD